MSQTISPKTLRWWTVGTIAGCAAVVTVCYFVVDRPVAYFVHEHHLSRFAVLRWLTYLPMAFNALAPVIVLGVAVARTAVPPGKLERALFAASISLIIALAFEYYLKFLFGRYWPDTWIDDNPSLIRNGAYGFHPFHFGVSYGSFPSGHTTRTWAALSVLWVAYPNWKWVWMIACGSVMVGLVGMNYHFVSDTIAGAVLGTLTGVYTARFLEITTKKAGEQTPRPLRVE